MKVPGLKVVVRTSAFAFKCQSMDVWKMGEVSGIYEAYLKDRHFQRQMTPYRMQRCRECLPQALALHPPFALPQVGGADISSGFLTLDRLDFVTQPLVHCCCCAGCCGRSTITGATAGGAEVLLRVSRPSSSSTGRTRTSTARLCPAWPL